MTEFSAVSLRIETVGDKEAYAALDLLDKKGRAVVDNAAGALGRAIGDVAMAYTRGSVQMRGAIEDVADAHRQEIALQQKSAQEAEKTSAMLTSRYGNSAVAVSRAFEVIGRTGRETGRSLDTVIAQGAQMAFTFGSAGPIVGAIGIATAAVVEMFMRASREAKKLADDVAKQFERIAGMDVRQQGEQAALLYNGNPDAANSLDRFGIKGLRAQLPDLQRRSSARMPQGGPGGVTMVMTDDAKEAAEQLDKVKRKLEEIEPLYASLYGTQGHGGSLERAGRRAAAEDLPGFITDKLKGNETAAKAAERAWDKAVKAFSDGVEQRKKDFDQLIATTVAKLTNGEDPNLSAGENLIRADARQFEREGGPLGSLFTGLHLEPHELSKQLHESIALALQAIKDDPMIAFAKTVKEMAKHMHEVLSKTLGDAISSGFETAFSNKGIGNAFKALTASVLSGLGSFLEQLGASMLITGTWLTAFSAAIHSLNGPGAIAAGVGLIAAGAALKALAGSFGGGASSGSGASGGYSASGLPQIIDRGIINPDTYSSAPASGIQARPMVTNNVTIIGPNDPQAQRAWDELQRKSQQRGSLAGARG